MSADNYTYDDVRAAILKSITGLAPGFYYADAGSVWLKLDETELGTEVTYCNGFRTWHFKYTPQEINRKELQHA